MSLRLGDTVPNFKAKTSIGDIDFYEYLGDSWGILFSHPADYTPVCTTELGKTALLKAEFDKRNTKVLALSVDDVESHKKWISDIDETQHTHVDFPIIADEDKKIATLFDMIHPNASETHTVRSLFIIGPDKKLKLFITYPASTGRNFNEVLRVLDSLQLTAKYSVATPANWNPGEDVIIGLGIKTEDAPAKFPKGVKVVKPYLRYTPQPDKD
ncbi:MAG: peroxiredoxin [Hydrotalea sp. AMD]|uniref:peroxiredoxin n=1 Tax=Hydrotalea sp. AMD TaxID=2501297 RepID=UPI00094534B4|nr:peroxiredoxin [Hydrotalea sp. AMD]RWZ85752.1 MAG: peroxiredoxin [Hydrotalea sp. AMD]